MKLLNLVLDNQNWKVLDGEIIVESIEGEGSTFSFVL